MAHELSSNAVRHGGGTGRLRLWRTATALVVQVSDTGHGLADPVQAGRTRPLPSVPGGRGLWIVRHLAAMEVDQGVDGTTITATITLPGPAARSASL